MHDVEQFITFNTLLVDDKKFIQTMENAFEKEDSAVVLYYEKYEEYQGAKLRS